MLEHKGLYWSKIKGTKDAATVEPDKDYVLPFGKAREVLVAESSQNHNSVTIITYGMGVYWAKQAAKDFPNQVEIIDLRTLVPLDKETIFNSVKKHNRCIVVTEEAKQNSFAQSISGLINEECFEYLDAPVRVLGALDIPAIPLNSTLEAEMLPNAEKLQILINYTLTY